MDRNCHEHREQHRVSWLLQAEVDHLLQSDRHQPGHSTRTQPVRRRVLLLPVFSEAMSDLTDQDAKTDHDDDAQ